MDRFEYPVRLEHDDNDTLLVTSPDFAELTTFGDNEPDALARAGEALRDVIGQYMDRDLDVPAPSVPKAGMRLVALPALMSAKIALWRRVRASGISLRKIAAHLEIDKTQLRRLMDPRQASRFDDVERALAALGARIELTVQPLVRRRAGKPTLTAFPSVVGPTQVDLLGFGRFTVAPPHKKLLREAETGRLPTTNRGKPRAKGQKSR